MGRGCQLSRLLAAELCASAVVMLDTPCPEVVWRVLATHSIRQFPLHFPSRAPPCAITFQLDSTQTGNYLLTCQKVVMFISRIKLLKKPTVVQTANSPSFTVNYCFQREAPVTLFWARWIHSTSQYYVEHTISCSEHLEETDTWDIYVTRKDDIKTDCKCNVPSVILRNSFIPFCLHPSIFPELLCFSARSVLVQP